MKSESAIRAKFKRLNVKSSNTKLWEDVHENIRSKVEQQIKMVDGEIKILFALIDASYWWILTNHRLILSENDFIRYFNLDEIDKVEPNQIFEGEVSKQECSELNLYLDNGRVDLKLEQNTWHAIYNILKFVISK